MPNSGRGLVTLPKRMEWDPKFQELLKDLDTKKPVIVCGDLNVAHHEIGTKTCSYTIKSRSNHCATFLRRHSQPKGKQKECRLYNGGEEQLH